MTKHFTPRRSFCASYDFYRLLKLSATPVILISMEYTSAQTLTASRVDGLQVTTDAAVSGEAVPTQNQCTRKASHECTRTRPSRPRISDVLIQATALLLDLILVVQLLLTRPLEPA